jgi:hypothetical protein
MAPAADRPHYCRARPVTLEHHCQYVNAIIEVLAG